MSALPDKITSTSSANSAANNPASQPRSAALRRFATYWDQLESRTRNVLLVCIATLAVGLIYSYVWLPAARGRVINAERIPALEAKLATMRAQYEEMKRINAVPPTASSSAANPAGGRTAADLSGLQTIFGANANVAIDDNRAFRISIASTGYLSFLDRLDQALARYRLSVTSLNLTALNADIAAPMTGAKKAESARASAPAPAPVSVEITLSPTLPTALNVESSGATKP